MGDGDPSGPVRCRSCGFLALRNDHTGAFHEPDDEYRATGIRYGPLKQCTDGPVCVAAAHDLRAELLAVRDTPEPQRSLGVIERERACGSHCHWFRGFSPKEHVEMIHTEAAHREVREWYARQRDLDRLDKEREKRSDRVWQIGVGVTGFLAGVFFNAYLAPKEPAPAPTPIVVTIPTPPAQS